MILWALTLFIVHMLIHFLKLFLKSGCFYCTFHYCTDVHDSVIPIRPCTRFTAAALHTPVQQAALYFHQRPPQTEEDVSQAALLLLLWCPTLPNQRVNIKQRPDADCLSRMSSMRTIISSASLAAVAVVGYGMWSLIAPGEDRRRELIKVIQLWAVVNSIFIYENRILFYWLTSMTQFLRNKVKQGQSGAGVPVTFNFLECRLRSRDWTHAD